MADTRLALELFGSFRATVDGTPLTGFRSDKARALLAYLAVEGDRPHSRSSLATLLWPDMLDEAARGNLRKTLHRLQETLAPAGEPVLLVTRQTIALNRAACCTDVTTFRELLAATAAHRHATLEKCDACVHRLVQAVALYRGELLAGFSLADADPFDEWLMLRRERFLHAALGALYRLTAADLERGEYDQALAHAVRQVELDPGREEAYRQAIRALLLSGQRTQARAYLERAGQMLRAVLGVELSPETLALLDDEEREVRGAAPPRQVVRRAIRPVQLPPVFTRRREPAATATVLGEPECRLASMAGLSNRVTAEIEIDVPIDQVFAYVTDPHNLVHWHQAASDIRDVSGPRGVGQRFTWTAHFLGRRLEVIHGVTDFEPNAVIAWRTVQGAYHAAHHFQFEPTNNGTRVTANVATQDLHFLARLAEPLIVRSARGYEQHSLETLKGLLELHGPDHPR
jgi:DNA-binding SARP family transcriptional activator/uncharacterized protein YndB with AHSA1/START domain